MRIEDGCIVLLKDGRQAQITMRLVKAWFARVLEDGERKGEPFQLDEEDVSKVVKGALTSKNKRDQGEEFDPLRGTAPVCCGAERACIGCPREESAA